MQTPITHTCGHRETVQLYGTNSHGERDRKAAWMASKPCRDCERAAETTHATEQAQVSGLPMLTGSDKQVAWAQRIRAEVITTTERRLATPTALQQSDQAKKGRKAFLVAVRTQTSAAWWIDHRDDALRALDPLYQAAWVEQASQEARG